MSRDTSIVAFNEIKENGMLKNLQFKVYSVLFKQGPLTASEMRSLIGTGSNSGVYATRLSELERKGVVTRIDKRVCDVTGKTAYAWDVTSKLPIDIVRPKTKKQKIDEVLKDLRDLYEGAPQVLKNDIAKIANKVKKI